MVHGRVGNSAAAYCRQAEGVNVAAVPTTLLSNHPRYPRPARAGAGATSSLLDPFWPASRSATLLTKRPCWCTKAISARRDNAAVVIADFVERALDAEFKASSISAIP